MHDENVEIIGVIMSFIGIFLLFVSIWSDGWNILRFAITGILLLLWGQGILKSTEKSKESKV